jgi:hypothetical protein
VGSEQPEPTFWTRLRRRSRCSMPSARSPADPGWPG